MNTSLDTAAPVPAPAPPLQGSPSSSFATRVALLDAAERLFSQHGIEGTSVRDIVNAAGANLGAINYHFGSKDRLALEVFARRIEPVNRQRLAQLDALEKAAGEQPPALHDVLDALIRPVLEAKEQAPKKCDDLMRILSRAFQEPNPEVKKFVEENFVEVVQRFNAAILRVVPNLSAGDLFWRFCFLHGALQHGMETWLRFDQISYAVFNPAATKPDREALIQHLISFMAAGMTAAPTGQR